MSIFKQKVALCHWDLWIFSSSFYHLAQQIATVYYIKSNDTNQVRFKDVSDAAAEDGVAVVPEVEVAVCRLPRSRTPQGPELCQDAPAGEDALALCFKPNLQWERFWVL